MLHSSFAFLSLQVIWDALAEISIVKELVLVLIGFTVLQIVLFLFNTLAISCPY